MAVLTGADGQLKYGDKVIGKTRNFSLNIARDAIETTALGEQNRTYTNGLRGATGSASLFYDPSDEDATSILNTIFSDTNNESLTFVVDKTDTRTFVASGFLTSVGTSVSVGDAQACEIQFQISGAVSGSY